MRTPNYRKSRNYTEKEIQERADKLDELQSKFEIKEYKRFRERKQNKEKLWKSINTFVGSFGEGTWVFLSVFGFVLSQIFWVYLLKGFIVFFYNYLNSASDYTLEFQVSLYQFTTIFWLMYVVWFAIMILFKFKINRNALQIPS
jgi:hypothetical protein